jgi:signal transduction histidine kinase
VQTHPAIIAHDARNVLAALQGRLQLIRRRTASASYDQGRALVDVDIALERLRHLTDLIDELVAVAQHAANDSPDRHIAPWDSEDLGSSPFARNPMAPRREVDQER